MGDLGVRFQLFLRVEGRTNMHGSSLTVYLLLNPGVELDRFLVYL